jgi:hypothetical protein
MKRPKGPLKTLRRVLCTQGSRLQERIAVCLREGTHGVRANRGALMPIDHNAKRPAGNVKRSKRITTGCGVCRVPLCNSRCRNLRCDPIGFSVVQLPMRGINSTTERARGVFAYRLLFVWARFWLLLRLCLGELPEGYKLYYRTRSGGSSHTDCYLYGHASGFSFDCSRLLETRDLARRRYGGRAVPVHALLVSVACRLADTVDAGGPLGRVIREGCGSVWSS